MTRSHLVLLREQPLQFGKIVDTLFLCTKEVTVVGFKSIWPSQCHVKMFCTLRIVFKFWQIINSLCLWRIILALSLDLTMQVDQHLLEVKFLVFPAALLDLLLTKKNGWNIWGSLKISFFCFRISCLQQDKLLKLFSSDILIAMDIGKNLLIWRGKMETLIKLRR